MDDVEADGALEEVGGLLRPLGLLPPRLGNLVPAAERESSVVLVVTHTYIKYYSEGIPHIGATNIDYEHLMSPIWLVKVACTRASGLSRREGGNTQLLQKLFEA